MEDDDQDDKLEVMNDEEDDNEEGVLMGTPGPEAVLMDAAAGPEAVLMDAAAVPQLAHDDDDDAVCLHWTECNFTGSYM